MRGDATNLIIAGCALVLCVSALKTSTQLAQEISYSVDTDDFERVSVVRVKRQSLVGENSGTSTTTQKIINIASQDTTDYYHIQYITEDTKALTYWRELSDHDSTIRHKTLQQAYRLAVKLTLKFPFRFYGHNVNTVTIATGGFLYMSKFLHSFLTTSQYIAPLMANFDTAIGHNDSEILYRYDNDALIIQWSNVTLKDQQEAGKFTFQVQLFNNTGKIIVVYKSVPLSVTNITSAKHPVKVGLSDAFYWDVGQYRTIHPYHQFDADKSLIQSNTALIYTHKTTCNMLRNCSSCLNAMLEGFTCYWCSVLNACSDAFDRQRQRWITSNCVFNTTQTHCEQLQPTVGSEKKLVPTREGNTWKAVTAAFCTVFGLSALVVLIFLIYGYRNPQSGIGQFLVRNRPSELWRKFKVWKDKDEGSANNMSHIG